VGLREPKSKLLFVITDRASRPTVETRGQVQGYIVG
jgi:hypothetical protein